METIPNKLKIYCETSFWSWLASDPSSNIDHAAKQEYTRKWWDEIAPHCDIFVSRHVFNEAQDGDPVQAAKRIALAAHFQSLDGHKEEIDEIARALHVGHAVPIDETADALHIATAVCYGMDVLLTWNCRHMANPRTLPKTAAIIVKVGYECPAILTPQQFLEHREEFGI